MTTSRSSSNPLRSSIIPGSSKTSKQDTWARAEAEGVYDSESNNPKELDSPPLPASSPFLRTTPRTKGKAPVTSYESYEKHDQSDSGSRALEPLAGAQNDKRDRADREFNERKRKRGALHSPSSADPKRSKKLNDCYECIVCHWGERALRSMMGRLYYSETTFRENVALMEELKALSDRCPTHPLTLEPLLEHAIWERNKALASSGKRSSKRLTATDVRQVLLQKENRGGPAVKPETGEHLDTTGPLHRPENNAEEHDSVIDDTWNRPRSSPSRERELSISPLVQPDPAEANPSGRRSMTAGASTSPNQPLNSTGAPTVALRRGIEELMARVKQRKANLARKRQEQVDCEHRMHERRDEIEQRRRAVQEYERVIQEHRTANEADEQAFEQRRQDIIAEEEAARQDNDTVELLRRSVSDVTE